MRGQVPTCEGAGPHLARRAQRGSDSGEEGHPTPSTDAHMFTQHSHAACTHTHLDTHTHPYALYTPTHTHTLTTYIHIPTHCIHTHTYTHAPHIPTHTVYTHTHAYTYTHIHTLITYTDMRIPHIYTRIHSPRRHTRTHTHSLIIRQKLCSDAPQRAERRPRGSWLGRLSSSLWGQKQGSRCSSLRK